MPRIARTESAPAARIPVQAPPPPLRVVPPPPPVLPDSPHERGFMLADLTPSGQAEPRFRVHDRTHLEFAFDCHLRPRERETKFEWEIYYFLPAGFLLSEATYPRDRVFEDLQSYLRFAAPSYPLTHLLKKPLTHLRSVIAGYGSPTSIVREMQFFACLVRASAVREQQETLRLVRGRGTHAQITAASRRMAQVAARLVRELGRAMGTLTPLRRTSTLSLEKAGRWLVEDVSKVFETLLATTALELREHHGPVNVAQKLEAAAIDQARLRDAAGLGGVGRGDAGARQIERLEFRRHILERFSSSALWLSPTRQPAAPVLRHLLYGVAAAGAMAFAIAAALWYGPDPRASGNLWLWVVAAMAAYAGKDRLKALLQAGVSRALFRRVPDRRWRIQDRAYTTTIGHVSEQLGYVQPHQIDSDACGVRYGHRTQDFEQLYRPETVLWHRKAYRVDNARAASVDPRLDTVTETLRLDVSRWLAHTDEPKRGFVFADPEDRRVYTTVAPRVYNIYGVYRLTTPDRPHPYWKRVRIVVSGKQILRLDPLN